MTEVGNDPLTKMAISATQLTLFFAIFLRYFSRLHQTNFSQIPQDLSLSCDPLIGMLVTPIKVQLGPIADGLITGENFAAAMAKQIAGATDFLTRYGERAVAARVDPFGFAWGPFSYSAGQVLTQAVTETKSLDHDKLAEYMHKASFKTVSGDFSFGKDGEWSKSRMVWTQVQNAQPPCFRRERAISHSTPHLTLDSVGATEELRDSLVLPLSKVLPMCSL